MKRLQYLVRVNKDAGSDWGASVPDLPGVLQPARLSTPRCGGSSEPLSSIFAGCAKMARSRPFRVSEPSRHVGRHEGRTSSHAKG